MGRDVFHNGYIEDDPLKLRLSLNDPKPQTLLDLTGAEIISLAVEIYEATTKNDPKDLAKLYTKSFSIRERVEDLVREIRVHNSDYTAEWVEFGAHAGGKTAILRYRCVTRAVDIIEGRGGI